MGTLEAGTRHRSVFSHPGLAPSPPISRCIHRDGLPPGCGSSVMVEGIMFVLTSCVCPGNISHRSASLTWIRPGRTDLVIHRNIPPWRRVSVCRRLLSSARRPCIPVHHLRTPTRRPLPAQHLRSQGTYPRRIRVEQSTMKRSNHHHNHSLSLSPRDSRSLRYTRLWAAIVCHFLPLLLRLPVRRRNRLITLLRLLSNLVSSRVPAQKAHRVHRTHSPTAHRQHLSCGNPLFLIRTASPDSRRRKHRGQVYHRSTATTPEIRRFPR